MTFWRTSCHVAVRHISKKEVLVQILAKVAPLWYLGCEQKSAGVWPIQWPYSYQGRARTQNQHSQCPKLYLFRETFAANIFEASLTWTLHLMSALVNAVMIICELTIYKIYSCLPQSSSTSQCNAQARDVTFLSSCWFSTIKLLPLFFTLLSGHGYPWTRQTCISKYSILPPALLGRSAWEQRQKCA